MGEEGEKGEANDCRREGSSWRIGAKKARMGRNLWKGDEVRDVSPRSGVGDLEASIGQGERNYK
eukprot:761063-Hanusia_phi.AAC.5